MNIGIKSHVAAVLSSLALVGCGGGGGGDGSTNQSATPAPTFEDGLGPTGRIAEAVAVSNGLPTYAPVISLDDSNRGLVVWSDAKLDAAPIVQPTTYYSTSSDQQGNWQAPVEVPKMDSGPGFLFAVPGLLTNHSGDVVLYSNTMQLRRFDPTHGWAAIADLPSPLRTFAEGSNALLSDGTLPVVTITDAPSGIQKIIRVWTQKGNDAFTTQYESNPLEAVESQSLRIYGSTNPAQVNLHYISHTDLSPPNFLTVQHVSVDLQTRTDSGPIVDLFANNVDYCGPWKFASSASPFIVAAFQLHRTEDHNCDLYLQRFITSASEPLTQRMTADNYEISLGDGPTILMDEDGDTLVIWAEHQSSDESTNRLMWSKSLSGGRWDTPMPLLPEEMGLGRAYAVRGAMNASGQGAFVISAIQNGRAYLLRSRFDFTSGWASWSRLVQVRDSGSYFDVAINSQGNALMAFRTVPCQQRTLLAGGGSSASGCGTETLYAVRF